MAKRDPYDVLGVEPGAPPAKVKAAWRRLARQHHPDLIGDDPEASRVATRKMAEINEAYAAISRGGAADRRPVAARSGGADVRPGAGWGATRRAASAEAHEAGHRTARYVRDSPAAECALPNARRRRPRGCRDHAPGPAAASVRGAASRAAARQRPDRPARARARIRDFRRPPPPPLEDAVVRELEFGKFRGHTLGEVAAFEPSYIDWLARTITRDPELVAAARVVQADLDGGALPDGTGERRADPGAPSGRSA